MKFTEKGEVRLLVNTERSVGEIVTLHFEVRDTGIGIPLDKQKQIFEAFSQADSSLVRKYGGTGLGLTISTRLVQMMGGRIWVESEPGRGSSFHFTAEVKAAVLDRPLSAPEADGTSTSQNLATLMHAAQGRGSVEHDATIHRAAQGDCGPISLRILLAEDNEVNRELPASMRD
jgi:hypothetical protein